MKTERATTSVQLQLELLQIENKHVTADELNTVSNKKTQALCSGLDSNRVHQSFLSLKHIHKFNHKICLHTETYHICFLLDCTTVVDGETYWSADESATRRPAGRFFWHTALRLNRLEWPTAQPSSEEQRYHRLHGPGVCCDQSGRRGCEGSQRRDRADSDVNFSDGVRTRLTGTTPTVLQLLHRIVLPPDFALVVVEQKHEEDIRSLKQKRNEKNAIFYGT